jgi:hypothetical protein
MAKKNNNKQKINTEIFFKNNKKHIMGLNKNLKIDDLIKLGVKEIRIVDKENKLEDNWWTSVPYNSRYSRYE